MKTLLVLLLSVPLFAQDEADLEKYRKQISEPTSCKPKLIVRKRNEPQYESYQLNCCAPLTLKSGGVARVEGEGGNYKIAVYKSKAEATASKASKDGRLLTSLGPPNQKCLQMKYYSNFDIITIQQYKGETNGYSEVAMDVVKIENGKPLKPKQFVLMNEDDGESTTILTPEISIQGDNLILSLTNRLEDQPVVIHHELNKLTFKE